MTGKPHERFDHTGKVECEPIIPEELWNQVNQIIEEQLKSWKKPGKTPIYLFSGLAHCACGTKMYVRSGSPKYVCRKCCNKIPINDLDNIIHQELKVFFTEPKRITHHLQAADTRVPAALPARTICRRLTSAPSQAATNPPMRTNGVFAVNLRNSPVPFRYRPQVP
jgi:hypothetical protein